MLIWLKIVISIKNTADLRYIFIKDLRNVLKLQKMSKNWRRLSLEETGSSYDQKFACSDNLKQNIWNKIKKSSKIEEDKKSLT